MTTDLTVFGHPKMPWKDRRSLISEVFPSVERLDWAKVFDADEGIFGTLLYTILQHDAAPRGRDGPRRALEPGSAIRRLRQLAGNDYSELPFAEAFRVLAAGRSVRHVATKVELGRSTVHRLLTGAQAPTLIDVRKVAAGFGKDPAYFCEYRSAVLGAMMADRLVDMPETSIDAYRKALRLRD